MSIEKIIIPASLSLVAGATQGNIQNHESKVEKCDPISELQKIPTKAEIRTKVYEIVSQKLGVKLDEISDNSSLLNDFEADSLDVVEVILYFEKEFGIYIGNDVIEKYFIVGQAVDAIFDIFNNGISLYGDNNFSGNLKLLTDDYDSYRDNIVENGLSSIIVPKGCKVFLFTEKDYKGEFIVINATEKEVKIKSFKKIKSTKYITLSNNIFEWNDKIVSIKVKR